MATRLATTHNDVVDTACLHETLHCSDESGLPGNRIQSRLAVESGRVARQIASHVDNTLPAKQAQRLAPMLLM
jgi:hypothetical protein